MTRENLCEIRFYALGQYGTFCSHQGNREPECRFASIEDGVLYRCRYFRGGEELSCTNKDAISDRLFKIQKGIRQITEFVYQHEE